jgi:hypothetical protein
VRLIFSLLAITLATTATAAPSKIAPLSKPSIADHVRHPQGQQVAWGRNCTTTCQYIFGQQVCNTHCF